jgi:hypothetical protein
MEFVEKKRIGKKKGYLSFGKCPFFYSESVNVRLKQARYGHF